MNRPGNPCYYLELRIVFPAGKYEANVKAFHRLYPTFDYKRQNERRIRESCL
jgi:hypothetical protein